MQDSERPETFLRRLLWKNSGILCIVTLITLPIIIGVAIGYVIILVFVTSYRKITGKKTREEKQSEAENKIRIVMESDLLDTAFTKSHELPGQRPKILRSLQNAGSCSNTVISSDDSGDELEHEELKEELEKSCVQNRSESESCDEEKVTPSKVIEQMCSLHQSQKDMINNVTNSVVEDISRTTSASSGNYSTASEMAEPHLEDVRKIETFTTSVELASKVHIPGGVQKIAESEKSLPHLTFDESGFFEERASKVLPLKHISAHVLEDTALFNKERRERTRTHKEISSLLPSDSQIKTVSSHTIDIPPYLGKLKYSVNYFHERNELQVTIMKAMDLWHENLDITNNICTFVRVGLLPQRYCWQKTKVIRNCRNPVYNETFLISGFSHQRFSNYAILISVVNTVFPNREFYGDHVIGELHVPLTHVVKYSSTQKRVSSHWAELKQKCSEFENCDTFGRVNVAICYRPISGRLIVTIKKAKDLKCDNKEKFEPFVKLVVYCDGVRIAKASTRVKRKVSSPIFNEKFNFDLNAEQIACTTIVLKVLNNFNSSCIGATVLGYDSTFNGQEHWMSMMKSLSKHIDSWHNLCS